MRGGENVCFKNISDYLWVIRLEGSLSSSSSKFSKMHMYYINIFIVIKYYLKYLTIYNIYS